MSQWSPLLLGLSSQALTALAFAYTAPGSYLRLPVAACVAVLTWLFQDALSSGLENHLYVALISTMMWIQCLKTFDDLCLTGISFEASRDVARQTNAVSAMTKLRQQNIGTKNGHTTNIAAFSVVPGPRPRPLRRISWALGMLWNARAIGTPWQIGRIPAWPNAPNNGVPTRARELRRHAQNLMLAYFVLDFSANQPPPPQDMVSVGSQPLFARGSPLSAPELVFRLFVVAGFWVNTFCTIQFINSLLAILQLLLHLQPVEMLPPVWGKLSDASTVRAFWGIFWHQTLRRCLTAITDRAFHSCLGLRQGSTFARYAKLVACFCISGMLHYSADLQLGIPPDQSCAVTFFLTTALAITFEDVVQHTFDGLVTQKGKTWRRWFGYAWVCFFMYWMTPCWAYPAARAVRPGKDVFLPFSLTKVVTGTLGSSSKVEI